MFPLLQQSGVANRWQRSDLKVTRRRRLRPFAPSLLSAVPSNGPTEPDGAPANPGLGKHHTQAYPRTKSDTDAVTFWQLRNSNRIEPVSRKLQVASRQWAKRIGQGGLRDVLQTNGEPGILYTALFQKGRNSGAAAACNPTDLSGNQGAPRRTTTMDPWGTRYPSLKPHPSH